MLQEDDIILTYGFSKKIAYENYPGEFIDNENFRNIRSGSPEHDDN